MAEEHKGKNKAKWKYKIIDLSISQHPQTLSGSYGAHPLIIDR